MPEFFAELLRRRFPRGEASVTPAVVTAANAGAAKFHARIFCKDRIAVETTL